MCEFDALTTGGVFPGAGFLYPVSPSASDTIRQQIMDAVRIRFSNILVANGYKTDIGNNVFEWRDADIEAAKLPAIKYRDSDGSIEAITVGEVENHIKVEVEISTAGSAGLDELRNAVADMTLAIGVDVTFGGLAQDTSLFNDNYSIEHVENKYYRAALSFDITFTTDRFNPYA